MVAYMFICDVCNLDYNFVIKPKPKQTKTDTWNSR